MANIIDLAGRKNAIRQAKKRSKGLCREGHHKWKILKHQQFDVKEGRLVTVYECEYCKKRKIKAL